MKNNREKSVRLCVTLLLPIYLEHCFFSLFVRHSLSVIAFVYLFIHNNSGKNKENTSKGVEFSSVLAVIPLVILSNSGSWGVINEFYVSRFLFLLPFFYLVGWMVSPWPICDLIGPSSKLGTEVGLNKVGLTGLGTSCSTDVVLGLD